MTLPDVECAFFNAALQQLTPDARPIFTERVARILGALRDPDCGDVDRAVRQALVGLWTPPPMPELRTAPRWDRASPRAGLEAGAVGVLPMPCPAPFSGQVPFSETSI